MNMDDQQNKTLDDLRREIETLLTSNTFRQTLQNKQTELSDKTTEEYRRKIDLMRSAGDQLPFQYCTERNLSKNAYRTLRAALKHYIVRELRNALLLGTEEAMSRAIKRARLAIDDEEQYYEPRPDATKERRVRESGRITKRKTLRGLPPDWREQIYYYLFGQKDGYALPALLVALSGCRPGELVKGVKVSRNDLYIDIVIQGSKQSEINQSGQETRTIGYLVDSPQGQELVGLILGVHEAMTIKIPKADSFQKAYKKAAIAVLGKKGQRISPYSARHQFSADLKAAGYEVDNIAKAMGHQSCRSQWAYGRKQQAKGGGGIKIDATTEPRFIAEEKAEREHPKFVKDKEVNSAKVGHRPS